MFESRKGRMPSIDQKATFRWVCWWVAGTSLNSLAHSMILSTGVTSQFIHSVAFAWTWQFAVAYTRASLSQQSLDLARVYRLIAECSRLLHRGIITSFLRHPLAQDWYLVNLADGALSTGTIAIRYFLLFSQSRTSLATQKRTGYLCRSHQTWWCVLNQTLWSRNVLCAWRCHTQRVLLRDKAFVDRVALFWRLFSRKLKVAAEPTQRIIADLVLSNLILVCSRLPVLIVKCLCLSVIDFRSTTLTRCARSLLRAFFLARHLIL